MYTQEEYEAKRNARYERLLAAAEKAEKESEVNWKQASLMASVIPFGQPILVGHYSEGRDRNYRARIESKHRKGYELHQKAQYYASRAASANSNDAIMSDDPSAVDQLTAKINEAKADQELWKTINAAYKKFLKTPASLDKCEISETYKNIIRNFKPEWSGDKPIRAYRFSNNLANIKRMESRAKEVSKKQALHDEDYEVNGVKVEGRPGENRIRLHFGKRVSLEMYNTLRRHGFRACKEEGTFSAYYNNNAIYFIKTELTKGA